MSLGNDKYFLLRGRRRTGIARKHIFMVTEVMNSNEKNKIEVQSGSAISFFNYSVAAAKL